MFLSFLCCWLKFKLKAGFFSAKTANQKQWRWCTVALNLFYFIVNIVYISFCTYGLQMIRIALENWWDSIVPETCSSPSHFKTFRRKVVTAESIIFCWMPLRSIFVGALYSLQPYLQSLGISMRKSWNKVRHAQQGNVSQKTKHDLKGEKEESMFKHE